MAEAFEGDKLSYSDQDWYHGELSKEEAEQALIASTCDCFLVRVSEGALTLSLIQQGQLHHLSIKHCRPNGYALSKDDPVSTHFNKLEELVAHYKQNDIEELKTLETACDKTKAGKLFLFTH